MFSKHRQLGTLIPGREILEPGSPKDSWYLSKGKALGDDRKGSGTSSKKYSLDRVLLLLPSTAIMILMDPMIRAP